MEAYVWKINILNTCLIKIRLLCDMVVVFVLFISGYSTKVP